MREGTDTGEAEIVGGLRPPEPYAFNRPSSDNFLRGLLCNVVLSISPRKQNAIVRISISCELLKLHIDENGATTARRHQLDAKGTVSTYIYFVVVSDSSAMFSSSSFDTSM